VQLHLRQIHLTTWPSTTLYCSVFSLQRRQGRFIWSLGIFVKRLREDRGVYFFDRPDKVQRNRLRRRAHPAEKARGREIILNTAFSLRNSITIDPRNVLRRAKQSWSRLSEQNLRL